VSPSATCALPLWPAGARRSSPGRAGLPDAAGRAPLGVCHRNDDARSERTDRGTATTPRPRASWRRRSLATRAGASR
jgi:hypothetical protein